MVMLWPSGCDSNVVMLRVRGVMLPSNSHGHITLGASLVPKSSALEGGELGQEGLGPLRQKGIEGKSLGTQVF